MTMIQNDVNQSAVRAEGSNAECSKLSHEFRSNVSANLAKRNETSDSDSQMFQRLSKLNLAQDQGEQTEQIDSHRDLASNVVSESESSVSLLHPQIALIASNTSAVAQNANVSNVSFMPSSINAAIGGSIAHLSGVSTISASNVAQAVAGPLSSLSLTVGTQHSFVISMPGVSDIVVNAAMNAQGVQGLKLKSQDQKLQDWLAGQQPAIEKGVAELLGHDIAVEVGSAQLQSKGIQS